MMHDSPENGKAPQLRIWDCGLRISNRWIGLTEEMRAIKYKRNNLHEIRNPQSEIPNPKSSLPLTEPLAHLFYLFFLGGNYVACELF